MGTVLSKVALLEIPGNLSHETLIGVILALPFLVNAVATIIDQCNSKKIPDAKGKAAPRSANFVDRVSSIILDHDDDLEKQQKIELIVATVLSSKSLARGSMPLYPEGECALSSSDETPSLSELVGDDEEMGVYEDDPYESKISFATAKSEDNRISTIPEISPSDREDEVVVIDEESPDLLFNHVEKPQTPHRAMANRLPSLPSPAPAQSREIPFFRGSLDSEHFFDAESVGDESSTAFSRDSERTLSFGDDSTLGPSVQLDEVDPYKFLKNNETSSLRHVDEISTHVYFEHCSRSLEKKSKSVDHWDKISIAQAIYQLGEILFKAKKYQQALPVFGRAVSVHKRVLRESLKALASAMKTMGLEYSKKGDSQLALLYLGMATQLNEKPNEKNMRMAMEIHKNHAPKNAEATPTSEKVKRRFQRAFSESFPLVNARKMKRECMVFLNLGKK